MDNAPASHFVSLPFLVGFGLGIFIGVALAIIAIGINEPEEIEPRIVEVPVLATSTPGPQQTQTTPVVATEAVAVRLGPGDGFATLGTLTRGDVLDVIGRDFDSEWLAIRFPLGSTIRGWIPASVAQGITVTNIRALAVLLPTPLPITIATPRPFSGTPLPPGTGTPSVEVTQGPPPDTLDLEVVDVEVLRDGRVRVVLINNGPADLTEGVLVVTVRTLSLLSETINSTTILATGSTLALTTSSFRVGFDEVDVQVIVDPSATFKDPDRTNNVAVATLIRPAEPTPTPTVLGAN